MLLNALSVDPCSLISATHNGFHLFALGLGSSPHRIGPGEPGEDTVFFVVLATDRKGGVALRTLTIERPTHATPAGLLLTSFAYNIYDLLIIFI